MVTVGQFAALPAAALPSRFGREAALAHALARGHDPAPLHPRVPPESRTLTRELEPPVVSAVTLEAVARQALGELAAALRAEGRAFRTLTLIVALDDPRGPGSGMITRTAHLAPPATGLADCRALLPMLAAQVGRAGPVGALTVRVGGLGPAPAQQPALLARADERAVRQQHLLAAAVEAERRYPRRLRRLVPHRPAALVDEQRLRAQPYLDPIAEADGLPSSRPRPARLVRQPDSYWLAVDDWQERVVAVHARWQAAEWWPAPLDRVYRQLRTASGRVCIVYHDRLAGTWWLVREED